eukprot:1050582-Prorocentrum_minimum.AAC.6
MVTICSSKIELRLKCCATPWVGHLRRSHAIDPTARVRRFNLSRSLTHMVTVNHSRSRRLEYTTILDCWGCQQITPTTVRIASGDSAGAANGETEQIDSPVQRGVVQNWDQLESLFHYLLYEKVRMETYHAFWIVVFLACALSWLNLVCMAKPKTAGGAQPTNLLRPTPCASAPVLLFWVPRVKT